METVPTSRKRSLSDMKGQMPHFKLIDEHVYRTTVLQLPPSVTEDELDEGLRQESQLLDLPPVPVSVEAEGMASSFSATTIGSDSNKQASLLSQSTAPTSCSSSEVRPIRQSSIKSGDSGQVSQNAMMSSETQRKSSLGFRNGLRSKMAGFKRRKSPRSTNVASDMVVSPQSDKISTKSSMKSPVSAKSRQSSWSSPASATKSSYEAVLPIDQEALKRSIGSSEMLDLQKAQMDERCRFLEFEAYLVAELRSRRESRKDEKRQNHRELLEERQGKTEKIIEDLEARQLEDELKTQQEHEAEKRTVMTRLRHMEAYCQNPTPPPTPVDSSSGRPSVEALPERKVTDKDYHNLAQQYRERDAMDNLHASKINVLRGKQKKAVENLIRKKEKETEDLEGSQMKELEQIDVDFVGQEANLRSGLGAKKARLEHRWRTQALIMRTKMEKQTGLKYGPLPDITVAELASLTAPAA